MPAGSSYFHVQCVQTFERNEAKKQFLAKGRSYIEGYLFAYQGWSGTFARLFRDPQYLGAQDALQELK